MKWKSTLFGIFWFFVLFGADQITKYLAILFQKGKEAFPIIKGVFEIQYLENYGAAFGVLQGKRGLLLILTVAILATLWVIYWKIPTGQRYFPLRFTGILLISGAFGNLADRLYRGYVVDFFYFKLINFPIFNVADCYVVIAAALLFFLISFYYTDEDFAFIKASRNNKLNF